jgi:uncharacterized protein involved in type VI secretion and phage assembly
MKQYNGVYRAVVLDNVDPNKRGRVKVRLPWGTEAWAQVTTMAAGNLRGGWFIPDQDDEVLVVFEQGDVEAPCVIGTLWNGEERPPESKGSDEDDIIKVIRTGKGVKVTIDEQDDLERLSIETPGGQIITLRDNPGSVTIEDSNGNTIKLEASGISVNSSSKVSVNAASIEVNAGMVTVNAGMTRFSGVVQCDTLISNSVVSASYTPGAGNVW